MPSSRGDIDAAKKLEKGYAQTAKAQDKAAKEVERLKRQYENQRQKRDTTEATLNRTKPLDELEREREELKRKIEEDRRIMNDKDATPQQRMVAGERFSENTDELARLDPQVQEREEASSFARTGQEHLQEVRLDPSSCCPGRWHCAQRSCPGCYQRA